MTIDLASLGITVLVLVLSFALGFVSQFFLDSTAVFGQMFVGFVEAMAGGRSHHVEPSTNKLAVFGRIVVYVVIVGTAIVLGAVGNTLYAVICAVAGGLFLGLATIKMFRR